MSDPWDAPDPDDPPATLDDDPMWGHEHDKLGELDRAICGNCNEPWWQCSVCYIFFCDCSRGL